MPSETGGVRDDPRGRAIKLFRYLRDIAELRLRKTVDWAEWDAVIWLSDLSEPDNCRTRLDEEDLDDWIRVERPSPPPRPPPPPPVLAPWVDPEQIKDWNGSPELREAAHIDDLSSEADGDSPANVVERLEDHPEVLGAWRIYQDRWLDWAAKREAVEPEHEIYRRFFGAHNRVVQLGEQYEVVLAVGLLRLRIGDTTVRRHLVTAPASLTYDTDSGLICVVPAEMGHQRIRLEDEMVPPDAQPTGIAGEIREVLGAADGPFEESVISALTRWVLAADAAGELTQDLRRGDRATTTPEVRFAPAVVLRKRQARSLRETYDTIIEELEQSDDGADIPPTVSDLVNDTSEGSQGDRMDDGVGPLGRFEAPDRPFFPLPANPQQHRIVEELGYRRGVVVQGPPGTGKSHTIANLISHCLATGLRVLVTSHTVRALQVLKGQLPDGIRDLVVSVLGAGREGAQDLQRSANALLAKRSDPNWSIDNLDREIGQLRERLQETERAREEFLTQLALLREAASEAHLLASGYSGAVGNIAQRLADEREDHDWLPDGVSGSMPIRYEEIVELCELREPVQGIDPLLASQHLPPPATLPTAERLEATRQDREAAQRLLDSLDGDTATAERLRTSSIDLQHLEGLLAGHDDADRAVRRRREQWLEEALDDLDAGRTNLWGDLRQRTGTYLDRSQGHTYDSVESTSVESSRLLHLVAQVQSLIDHLNAGGRLSRFFGRPRVVRRSAEAFEVAGNLRLPLSDMQTAGRFRALLEELHTLDELARLWGRHLESPQGTLARTRLQLRDHRVTLDHLNAVVEARARLSDVAGDLLGDPVDTAEDVDHLRGALQVAQALTQRDNAGARHRELLTAISSANQTDAHQTFRQLFEAARGLEVDQYRNLRDDLERLFVQQKQLERFHHLHESLSDTAPEFATALLEGSIDIPEAEALDRAWCWSWALGEVERLQDQSEIQLSKELDRADTQIRDYTKALTTKLAWRNTLYGLSDYGAQELKAYQHAIKLLGKGTGRKAATYRRDAQQHLENCRTAMGAWIMPTYRVAETLRAEREAFDLVIVDEASQSGIDAMFLFWLGKQMVIVGDDNQISPSNIGIEDDVVTALQNKHLHSFGLRTLLRPDSSLFDQAKVRYSGEV